MTDPTPKKFDTDKPRYDLLPPKALGLLVDCLTYGAKKYDDYNWRKDGGIDPNRLFAATQRHLWAWKDGEVMDKESGLSHLAHAATNLLMMLDLACRPPVKIPNFSPKPVQDLTTSEIEAGLERAGWPKEPEPSSEEKLWATPAQPLDVTNALMELRTKYLGVVYDIVSEWENVRYFDAGCSAALTLAHLGLFGYARSFTTMQGKERDEYNRTPLGYAVRAAIKNEAKPKTTQDPKPPPGPETKLIFGIESEAYYWISRCSPESRAYKAVVDSNDWVSLDNTEDNLKFAESLSAMFEKTSTARASTITLYRTPLGHKIRSLLNAKS